MKSIKTQLRRFLNSIALVAAKRYVAGEKLGDAILASESLEVASIKTTFGFFDDPRSDSQTTIFSTYLNILAKISETSNYLSIKLTSLKFDSQQMLELVHKTKSSRIHCDAMWPDSVSPTKQVIDSIGSQVGYEKIGFTIPARWGRSLSDANWAAERNLAVRVVKGQWVDPDNTDIDIEKNYLAIVRALAGRARLVAIATHEPELAEEAFKILQQSNTPFELELLYGLPCTKLIQLAKRHNVKVRVYVPFGKGYLPYALDKLLKNPKIIIWLLKDALKFGPA
jgi:proline dehydrogenase